MDSLSIGSCFFSNITCALCLISPKLSNICQLYVYVCVYLYSQRASSGSRDQSTRPCIASRHTLKSGVVSSVSRAWFGLNVSVPYHCPAKCFRRIFSQIRSGQYDVLADFDFFMIMKILNIDDTCISIKLILHYTTSTAVPTDWVTRVYLYTLLIIYFHKFHFMKTL